MIYEYFITINNPSIYHHVSQEREKIFKAQWYKKAISLIDVSKSQKNDSKIVFLIIIGAVLSLNQCLWDSPVGALD